MADNQAGDPAGDLVNGRAGNAAGNGAGNGADKQAGIRSGMRISTPADLLSYVPHLLGFLPVESLVVLTFSARRLGATLRVDLPRQGTDLRSFAGQVASYLRPGTGADSAVVVLYTDAGWTVPDRPPHGRMVRELGRSLEAAGVGLRDAWVVSSNAWRNYFCRDPRCCPLPGNPVADIADSRLSAELIYGGSSFSDSAETAVGPAPLPGTSPTACRTVEFHAARYRSSCADVWTAAAQFRASLGVWEAAIGTAGLHPPDPDPETAGFLLASLGSKAIRDSVLVLAALGRVPAELGAAASNLLSRREPRREPLVPPSFRAAAPGAQPAATVQAPLLGPTVLDCTVLDCTDVVPEPADARRYTGLLAGTSAEGPQWDRLDSAYLLLIRLAAVASGEDAAAVHSMLAWMEFARGRGSRACVYLGRAERACPGYRLAGLLKELIDRGGMPVWARRPETAWPSGDRPLP